MYYMVMPSARQEVPKMTSNTLLKRKPGRSYYYEPIQAVSDGHTTGFRTEGASARLCTEAEQIRRLHRQEVQLGRIQTGDGGELLCARLENFGLPNRWNYGGKQSCPIYLLVPADYPQTPPLGFLLPSALAPPECSDMKHLFGESEEVHLFDNELSAESESYTRQKVDMGRWSPSGDANVGDNLIRYLTLVFLLLGQPSRA